MKNGLTVWYCKRKPDAGDGIERFEKPVAYRLRLGFLTIQPASGYDSVVEFGENISKMWNGMAQPYRFWVEQLKEGDRFYVDGVTPSYDIDGDEPEDGWGFDANARVRSVRPQNLAIKFILQKIE